MAEQATAAAAVTKPKLSIVEEFVAGAKKRLLYRRGNDCTRYGSGVCVDFVS